VFSARGVFLGDLLLGSNNFMRTLRTAARSFINGEEGASLAEYGLLLALIAVLCIASIALLGTNVSTMFSQVSTSV
jgi:pilus assembly protein Flp/PilA